MLVRQSFTDENGSPVIDVAEPGFYVVLKVESIPQEILDDGTVTVGTRFVCEDGGAWGVKKKRFIETPRREVPDFPEKREAKGPVGPEWGNGKPICHGPSNSGDTGLPVCGHKWSDHDDYGCLFYSCDCTLPGERK